MVLWLPFYIFVLYLLRPPVHASADNTIDRRKLTRVDCSTKPV